MRPTSKTARYAIGAIVIVAAGYGIQRALIKRTVHVGASPLSGATGAVRF